MEAQPGASWSWPEEMAASSTGTDARPEARARVARDQDSAPPSEPAPHSHSQARPEPQPEPQPQQRHYRPRTCRICLEVVNPTFDVGTSRAAAFLGPKPQVRYISEDPELGRLLSPCRCKGSQKYVHEGCLQAWRQAQPLAERNFWKCPTCGFEYKLERLRWGRWISSRAMRVFLTVLALFLTVFILGFVADPIIALWIDPFSTVVNTMADHVLDFDSEPIRVLEDTGPRTWLDHFTQGFFSLGVIGFAKSLLAASPWYWFNMRNMAAGRRRGTGRDRLEGFNLVVVAIGVFTFLAVSTGS